MLKVGIIGAGNMGGLHGRILSNNKAVKVVGITDMSRERADKLAKDLGAVAYDTVDALLDSKLDMVFITVPNTKHAALAIQALNKGVHVFVEKPLATSLEDARAVKEAAKKAGKRVFVGLNRRFAPVYAEAKTIVNNPDFKATNINIIQNDGDMINPPWLIDLSMTGGFMYDTTVHFLDMARFLMGEVIEVRALGKATCYPIMDDLAIQLKFENGTYGVISTCGHASWISPFERVQVVGDHKSVITEELDILKHSPGLGTIIDARDYAKLGYDQKWGYIDMHEHMFNALFNDRKALNDLEEGYKAVELIEACTKSAENDGEIIRL